MNDYQKRIMENIDYLNSIKFPSDNWQDDKAILDRIEQEFSAEVTDKETKQLVDELRKLLNEKRKLSFNVNKTAEELYEGWDNE